MSKWTEEKETAYVKRGGMLCPECGSRSLEASNQNADFDWITFDVACSNCGYQFKDVYELVHYSDEE